MFNPIGLCFLLLQFYSTSSSVTDTINPTESITDGEIIVSAGSHYALGFFSPGNSSFRYVGIWYYKIPERTVVWVANRDNPINDSSGVLSLASDGNLVVSSGSHQSRQFWSTNVSTTSNTTVLKLLNSGNLVLYGDLNRIVWQSFDYPTQAWLPGMKLGLDRRTGLNQFLTSWKSKDDPGHGIYTYGFDPRGSPQAFLRKRSKPLWRTGLWNGQAWGGIPEMTKSYVVSYDFVNNTDEVYLVHHLYNNSIFSLFLLDESGDFQGKTWVERSRQWNTFYSAPTDWCDNYGHCGPYGFCNMDNQVECSCLPSFQPKSPRDWYLREWSGGCVRKRNLGCGKGDGFMKLVGLKLPDTAMFLVNMNLSLEGCKQECLSNCSCTAYAPAYVTGGGSGCIVWFDDLMDIRSLRKGSQDFYLRIDAVELAAQKRPEKGFLEDKRRVEILMVSLVVGVLLFAACLCVLIKNRKGATERRQQSRPRRSLLLEFPASSNPPRKNELEDTGTNPELPFIELDVVVAATDNFSPSNMLGQGGFGAVYKGRMLNGKEIAVKRLSKKSDQGMEEFKNEVQLIAKLQHRNLVGLLACCVHEEEKILIYEYMPNKSLDFFIFDEGKRRLLDWRTRYEIIVGIARGVLYLHQDSRLRIIHRDLKASNVLLDEQMNPKISDFGMARIFGGDQVQANTTKVVGTYGYMSPEYAMQGLFSIKSDVFSFGILLLEIISGKKNSVHFQGDPSTNLIEHIWDLWKEDRALEIVDLLMGDSSSPQEVLRCIQVGLLCVQGSPSDRPTMSNVIFMLGSETQIPTPNQPALIMKRTFNALDSSTTDTESCSINGVTITMIEPR